MNYVMMILFGVLVYLLMREKRDHGRTKNQVAVLKRMGDLNEIDRTLDVSISSFEDSLAAHTNHLVPDSMLTELGRSLETDLPPGNVQEATHTSEPPKYFKAVAVEDLREGQAVEISVHIDKGRTEVRAATPDTGSSSTTGNIVGAAKPTES